MSKANRLELAQIADEALQQIDHGVEHLSWLEALLGAIRLDAEHNQGRRVADLATVAEYVLMDTSNLLDCQAEQLKTQLQTAERHDPSQNPVQEETVH
ncbi:hypothetical protein SAMN04244572_03186 [Azotobacter beijerinckii]|uniref:Uncharacterized protein n=1 Tax=Azotobacter beijerinckii TaxID=170623 RepID=A0A1H6XDY5_9GAMM|nr:hypothetical protein [Azotobacter beijerinckii]SEJ22745.1 hypothetical protein SAMN04244572_03186 [Azotobacter beijerinckii]